MAKTVTPYSDFNIAFIAHPQTGDLVMVTGVNSVVQSVMNLCQLNHFEVPFHPEIGGNIRRLLFELADPVTASLLSEEIKNTINNFEPRAKVLSVDVITDAEGNGYDVTITFTVLGNSNPLTINFFLERLR